MEKVIDTLLSYYNEELPKLSSSYAWKIPKISGFILSGQTDYEANVKLKKHFNFKWKTAKFEQKLEVTKQIIADWGGVRSNKEETLRRYIAELSKVSPKTPLKGVASYSKVFAMVDMQKYAIYDARVAACLNAIQWNANIDKGIAFNYINGRNNVVGHAGKRLGFVYQEPFKVKSLVKKGWKRIKRDDTYLVYMNVLQECLKYLSAYSLYDLEMVLFANAEQECLKAMYGLQVA